MPFQTTSWSLILRARVDQSSEAREALARLCERYWPPVYAFIRHGGRSPADAEDLTQAYFVRFLEKNYLDDFRPEAGRFRTFLRVSVAHFLANERDRERALKRGGGRLPISLDASTAEERLRLEPVVHRLRRRFGALLREEVADTVRDAADVDAEIGWLLGAVRGER